MLNDIILTLMTFLPLAGAIIVAFLPRKGHIIQWWTLLVSIATFLLTLHLPAHFDYAKTGFQFGVNLPWIAHPAIRYHLGVDGFSMWLIVLTGFLMPIGVLVSWKAIKTRTKEFYILFLIQQTAMLGVFVSLDLFLYYAFWELTLVPMTILIAMFGRTHQGPRAAIKFFLYAFIPSALLLVAILWLYGHTGTFEFGQLQTAIHNGAGFTATGLIWASLAFLVAFAVKVPVFPLHGWLSDAISEAPTAMAMVIAGKLGLYSILRFNLGLFPHQSRVFAPWLIALAVIGLIYGALVALVQKQMKRLLAYGILSSLSFCTLGIFSFTVTSLNGAVYQTITEGLSGGALLVLLGILYERYGTYEMADYAGLSKRVPHMATLFVFTTLSLIGLPILNGFVGEFLVLSGSFPEHHAWVVIATSGVILSASYMLWMIQRTFYGPPSAMAENHATYDVTLREGIMVWPMIILMVAMGVVSPFWIKAIQRGIEPLANLSVTTQTTQSALETPKGMTR